MSRNNKLLNMPIANAIHSDGIPKFLKLDSSIGTALDENLQNYLQKYKEHIKSVRPDLKHLANMEVLISQLRCRNLIKNEMKIYISQSYVYARSTFFRHDKQIKDIRVLMGSVSDLGTDMDTLSLNDKFMDMAHHKLYDAMTKEIDDTIKIISNITIKKEV